MAANPNGENVWQNYMQATCLVMTTDRQGSTFNGTGFLYGDSGWVMTVAHNFQNDDGENMDPRELHSLLQEAEFKFFFNRESFDFPHPPPNFKRTAFAHHLQAGKAVDSNNMDIAMVKLGSQFEYGRISEAYTKWENSEKEKLDEMISQARLSCFATIDMREVVPDENVYALDVNNNRDGIQRTKLKVVKVMRDEEIPIMELHPAMQPAASGCPILNEKKQLVGVLVGGGTFGHPQATDDALLWDGGIHEYIKIGCSIITALESYMKEKAKGEREKAKDERKKLEEKAKKSNLTIYLMDDDDIINGPPNANDNA